MVFDSFGTWILMGLSWSSLGYEFAGGGLERQGETNKSDKSLTKSDKRFWPQDLECQCRCLSSRNNSKNTLMIFPDL